MLYRQISLFAKIRNQMPKSSFQVSGFAKILFSISFVISREYFKSFSKRVFLNPSIRYHWIKWTFGNSPILGKLETVNLYYKMNRKGGAYGRTVLDKDLITYYRKYHRELGPEEVYILHPPNGKLSKLKWIGLVAIRLSGILNQDGLVPGKFRKLCNTVKFCGTR